jgi:hypothetical protein
MLNAAQIAHRTEAESLLAVARFALSRVQAMCLEVEQRRDLQVADELLEGVLTPLTASLDADRPPS